MAGVGALAVASVATPAIADCTTSGLTTTCSSAAPNPYGSVVGLGPSAPSGSIVNVLSGSEIAAGDANAISVGNNATITLSSGSTVQSTATTAAGLYLTGGNTIEFNNNTVLTIAAGAQVLSLGTAGDAEAINPQGTGNLIVNNGTILATHAAAFWFQSGSGSNIVVNNATGLIETQQASGLVLGGGGTLDFTNKGVVIGSLVFGGGNDILRLYTGSSTTGAIDGGGGANTLYLNGAGSDTLADGVTNFQTLIKQDAGSWTVSSSLAGFTSVNVQQGQLLLSGVSAGYTGSTTVTGGALAVTGQIAGSTVTVDSGGELGGGGTVGGVVVNSGGAVVPGWLAPYTTLHVSGNQSFAAGSMFGVNIDPTGRNDGIAATGATHIAGGSVDVTPAIGDYSPSLRYKLISSTGGVTGTFAALDMTADLAYLSPSLSYDANDVYLGFAVARPIQAGGQTPNERAMGGAIQTLGPGTTLYNALVGQLSATAPAALDALSGEIHASAISAAFNDAQAPRDAVLDRMANPGCDDADLKRPDSAVKPLSSCPDGRGLAAWGQVFRSFGEIGSNGNAAAMDSAVDGFAMGVDANVNGPYRLGVMGGYTSSQLSIEARGSTGSVDTGYVGVYGGMDSGALRARAGAFLGISQISTQRDVAFPGFADSDSANYGGGSAQLFGELGWRIDASGPSSQTWVEPFAGVLAMRIHSNAFTEAGGASALTGAAADYDYAATTLGVRWRTSTSAGSPISMRGLLGWRHVMGDVAPNATLAFASAPTVPFVVQGASVARDAMLVEAGLDWRIARGVDFTAYYSGTLADRNTEHAFKGQVDWAF